MYIFEFNIYQFEYSKKGEVADGINPFISRNR